ncbi:tetratricopeptide repeat protein, partial [Lacticaseibacillus paracasei]|uniref:tetratricopeptide repeat protein n=1 Tax=Lacticaseibacillus paracasei TaxID=1597 RepID=UPI00237F64AB
YEAAIADYTKAIELDGTQADYYKNRAITYHHMNDYKAAIADYTKAIELDGTHANYYYDRGIAYANNHNDKAAIADYTKAIELDGTRAGYYNNRGTSYANNHNYEAAIADYTKAIELDKLNPMYRINRGIVEYNSKDLEAALKDLYNETISFANDDVMDNFRLKILMEYLENSQNEKFNDMIGLLINENDITLNRETGLEFVNVLYNCSNFLVLSLQKFDSRKDKPNRLFYQYTNASTLSKICSLDVIKESQRDFSLRLYNEKYMNDPNEGKTFLEAILPENGSKKIESISLEEEQDVFIASLTKEDPIKSPKTVPLWGTYGSNHNGVALGMEINELPSKKIKPQIKEDSRIVSNLYKVFYENGGNPDVQKCIDEIKRNIGKIVRSDAIPKRTRKVILNKVSLYIRKVKFLYKKSYYSYENEFRIIKQADLKSTFYEKNDPRLFVTLENTGLDVRLKKVVYGAKFKNPYLWEPIIKRNLGNDVEWVGTKIEYR